MGYYMAGGSYTVESKGSGGAQYQDQGFLDDGYGPPPRRMNKWNGRALSRAMRRVKGFTRFARKAVRFAQTVKMKGRRR